MAEPPGFWSRSRVRLHEEILPPQMAPATPLTLRRAKRAIGILVIMFVVLQVISAPIGHRLNAVLRSGTDVYSQWLAYTSAPAPDVLFLGASTVGTDIDTNVLVNQLSIAAGRPVSVGKLGFFGQGSTFLDVVMYRIMKRVSRPKVVVVTLEASDLNASCVECQASSAAGIWDISDLTDPGFVKFALQTDVVNPGGGGLGALAAADSRAPLILGWALPSFAYYPSLLALQCLAVDYGRSAARAVFGEVPGELRASSICETAIAYQWSRAPAMTEASYLSSIADAQHFMSNYRISTAIAARLTDIVNRGRAAGSNVVFLEPPIHSGAGSVIGPEAQPAFGTEVSDLTTALKANVLDFTAAVPDDPNFWLDTLHLNRAGADYLAPKLAQGLAPIALSS